MVGIRLTDQSLYMPLISNILHLTLALDMIHRSCKFNLSFKISKYITYRDF